MDMPVLKKLRDNFERIKFTFAATFLIGIITHGYMFANSITNSDNIKSFMRVSGTWTSGRWLLGILKNLNEILFGTSVSVPWLIGIIGCIWLALSTCVLIELFDVKSRWLQLLIGSLFIAFPSVTATYTYMFTSGYYFFAVFMTVLAVFLAVQEGTKRMQLIYGLLSSGLLAASLGIYQGYLGIACCLMAFYIFLQILFAGNEQGSTSKLFINALKMLANLIIGFGLYYVINTVILKIMGLQMNQVHASSQLVKVNMKDLVNNLRLCYRGIYDVLIGDFYGISNIRTFRITFGFCLAIMLGACCFGICKKIKEKQWLQALMIFVIAAVFPVGMNNVLLLTGGEGVHTLMTYAVVVMFMMPVFLWNSIRINVQKSQRLHRRAFVAVFSVLLFLTSGSNILQANKAYRKMDMANQYAVSYLTTLITQIKGLEGYQDGMPILFIGSVLNRQDSTFSGYEKGWGDVDNMMGVFDAHLMANAAFLEYFCGFRYEIPEHAEELRNSDVVKQMPCYPDYGSILIYENIVVVKLSEG